VGVRILVITLLAAVAGMLGALVTRADAAPVPVGRVVASAPHAGPGYAAAASPVGGGAYPASMTLTIARGVSTVSDPSVGSAAAR
jgi:hypothetical protein